MLSHISKTGILLLWEKTSASLSLYVLLLYIAQNVDVYFTLSLTHCHCSSNNRTHFLTLSVDYSRFREVPFSVMFHLDGNVLARSLARVLAFVRAFHFVSFVAAASLPLTAAAAAAFTHPFRGHVPQGELLLV